VLLERVVFHNRVEGVEKPKLRHLANTCASLDEDSPGGQEFQDRGANLPALADLFWSPRKTWPIWSDMADMVIHSLSYTPA